jgi:peptidoglycan/LPS O-acetylase OafA/YrhL
MLEDDLNAMMTAPRDGMFTLGVMARIERRQFRRAMIANIALALAAAALLALAMPALTAVWQVTFAPHASNLIIGMALMVMSYAGLRYYATQA